MRDGSTDDPVKVVEAPTSAAPAAPRTKSRRDKVRGSGVDPFSDFMSALCGLYGSWSLRFAVSIVVETARRSELD